MVHYDSVLLALAQYTLGEPLGAVAVFALSSSNRAQLATMLVRETAFSNLMNAGIPRSHQIRRRRLRRPFAVMAQGQQKPLVVVGSVNADLVLHIDRLPQPGETLGASNMQFFPGGKVGGSGSVK